MKAARIWIDKVESSIIKQSIVIYQRQNRRLRHALKASRMRLFYYSAGMPFIIDIKEPVGNININGNPPVERLTCT
jgi:hypothetical protein